MLAPAAGPCEGSASGPFDKLRMIGNGRALRDHERISGSRLVVRKRCAHGSRWRLETFLSEIDAFLDDVEEGRPVAGERVV